MAIQQTPLAGMEKFRREDGSPNLLAIALSNNAAIDVIERLAVVQREERAFKAEVAFNEAMNDVQAEIGRVAPDANNPQTRSKYATYAAIDRVVRPIYTKHGFSLSFDSEPLAPEVELLRVLCYVSHREGHTRKYTIDMAADGKGAKGGDVMTKTHARGGASAYGMRYLVKMIFNVAIGEDDNDGSLSMGWLSEKLEWIENCRDLNELKRIFQSAYTEAKEANAAAALLKLVQANDKRKADLQ
jgi:hypothetical protein